MLTNVEPILSLYLSVLQVRLTGRQVNRGHTDLFRQVSYCPQDDPLWNLLTVDEHLNCYAALRGVSASQRKSYVDRLCLICLLSNYIIVSNTDAL